jgi:hypothetical protein
MALIVLIPMKLLTKRLRVEFVPLIPELELMDDGTIYVSIDHATISHKCCCGCGEEVTTPIAPDEWRFTYDGETISLFPSIGNDQFNCKSHYWIRESRAVPATYSKESKHAKKKVIRAFFSRLFGKGAP